MYMKKEFTKEDAPNYYIGRYKKIEALDVVLDFQEDNYNIGVAIAYLLRAGKKPDNDIIQDLEKAVVHLSREITHQLLKKAADGAQ